MSVIAIPVGKYMTNEGPQVLTNCIRSAVRAKRHKIAELSTRRDDQIRLTYDRRSIMFGVGLDPIFVVRIEAHEDGAIAHVKAEVSLFVMVISIAAFLFAPVDHVWQRAGVVAVFCVFWLLSVWSNFRLIDLLFVGCDGSVKYSRPGFRSSKPDTG